MVMKRRYTVLLLVMATIIGNLARGQEPSSFYFTAPQPKGADFISSVPKAWHGVFTSEKDSTLRLYIRHDSVYTEAPVAMMASVEEAIAQGSQVLDSVIVVENDSLPCWVHNDTVYFFLYIKKMIFCRQSEQKLFLQDDYLLLNSKNDKGYWETSLFINQGMAVELAYFDHSASEEEIKKKKKIKKEIKNGVTSYYASFKEKEWKNMLGTDWFPYKTRFIKLY
jgi:hypothetical protein